jgi:hypothetical protein
MFVDTTNLEEEVVSGYRNLEVVELDLPVSFFRIVCW